MGDTASYCVFLSDIQCTETRHGVYKHNKFI